MPDISLRFHKDMLVLSAPVSAALARQGVNVDCDLEYINLVEPEAVRDALRLESLAGAQCLVTSSEGIAPARLAHQGMEERMAELADATLGTVQTLKPQHSLVEIGPCGLPLDGSSAASLNESRDQYVRVARAFSGKTFDAFFLNGFRYPADIKCALMGLSQVSDAPIFVSVDVDAEGLLADGHTSLEEAVALMVEFGASVVGFSTGAPLDAVCGLAKRACVTSELPALVQLRVASHAPRQGAPTEENPYYCPDIMVEAATRLRGSGVQFLRALGQATPAYTGALVAASDGFDVIVSGSGA